MNEQSEWVELEKPDDWPEDVPWMKVHYDPKVTTLSADYGPYYWHDPADGWFKRILNRISDWRRGVDYYGRPTRPGGG